MFALSRFRLLLFNKLWQPQQLNIIFQGGIWNMTWVSIRTKWLLPDLKCYLPMKHKGAINTKYLALIKYQRRNLKKNLFFKGATKLYYTHYTFVVYKSLHFLPILLENWFFSFFPFCVFSLFCVEFDVVFINFKTFA